MYARTFPIPDPGTLPERFVATGVCWLRNGDGLLGYGQAAHFQPENLADAENWWQRFCAELKQDNELPEIFGTGALAFVSLPFDLNNTIARPVLQVPKLIIGKRRGQAWVTILSENEAELHELPNLPSPPNQTHAPTPLTLRPVGPRPASWREAVARTVRRLDDNLTKVVLARAANAIMTDKIDPVYLVRWLASRYPSCWTYYNAGLVGATPELLVRLEHGLVTSRVLAGTIRRNTDEELDMKLAQTLARSSKNLVEHQFAVESVAKSLAQFSLSMNVPERPFVLELPNVLHLASDVTARVREEANALRVVGALHPSAAVCGTPTQVAQATIAELEQLDRGRYSGPVGWIDAAGDGEFGIALRCGQIDPLHPSSITIYAGCGIVAESDPDEEYAETEAKLVPMLQALGFDQDPLL